MAGKSGAGKGDFQIIAGLDVSTSTANIESALKKIMKDMTDAEWTIKVKADVTAVTKAMKEAEKTFKLDAATKQVEKLESEFGKLQQKVLSTMTKNFDVSGVTSGIQKVQHAFDSFKTDQTEASFKNLKATFEEFKSSVGNMSTQQKQISTLESGLKSLDKAITNLGKDGKEVDSLRTYFDKVTKSVKEYKTAMEKGGSEEQLRDLISRIISEYQGLEAEIEKTRQAEGTFGNEAVSENERIRISLEQLVTAAGDVRTALKQLTIGQVAGMAISKGLQIARTAIRQMWTDAKELNSALAQLQIVTGVSGGQLEEYFDKAADAAQRYGVTVKDMLGSIEVFSRLGYSIQDSLDLSEIATVLGNIADMDVSTATSGITSIIKGWGLSVSEAEHIADVISIVGKNYAISSEEIVTAAMKSGAALNASNTSLEKSIALYAAANASVEWCRIA